MYGVLLYCDNIHKIKTQVGRCAILLFIIGYQKTPGGLNMGEDWEWRDGSVLKNSGDSCRELGFDDWYPHSLSQPSVNPVPVDPSPFHLRRHKPWTWCTDNMDTKHVYPHKITKQTNLSKTSKGTKAAQVSHQVWRVNKEEEKMRQY